MTMSADTSGSPLTPSEIAEQRLLRAKRWCSYAFESLMLVCSASSGLCFVLILCRVPKLPERVIRAGLFAAIAVAKVSFMRATGDVRRVLAEVSEHRGLTEAETAQVAAGPLAVAAAVLDLAALPLVYAPGGRLLAWAAKAWLATATATLAAVPAVWRRLCRGRAVNPAVLNVWYVGARVELASVAAAAVLVAGASLG